MSASSSDNHGRVVCVLFLAFAATTAWGQLPPPGGTFAPGTFPPGMTFPPGFTLPPGAPFAGAPVGGQPIPAGVPVPPGFTMPLGPTTTTVATTTTAATTTTTAAVTTTTATTTTTSTSTSTTSSTSGITTTTTPTTTTANPTTTTSTTALGTTTTTTTAAPTTDAPTTSATTTASTGISGQSTTAAGQQTSSSVTSDSSTATTASATSAGTLAATTSIAVTSSTVTTAIPPTTTTSTTTRVTTTGNGTTTNAPTTTTSTSRPPPTTAASGSVVFAQAQLDTDANCECGIPIYDCFASELLRCAATKGTTSWIKDPRMVSVWLFTSDGSPTCVTTAPNAPATRKNFGSNVTFFIQSVDGTANDTATRLVATALTGDACADNSISRMRLSSAFDIPAPPPGTSDLAVGVVLLLFVLCITFFVYRVLKWRRKLLASESVTSHMFDIENNTTDFTNEYHLEKVKKERQLEVERQALLSNGDDDDDNDDVYRGDEADDDGTFEDDTHLADDDDRDDRFGHAALGGPAATGVADVGGDVEMSDMPHLRAEPSTGASGGGSNDGNTTESGDRDVFATPGAAGPTGAPTVAPPRQEVAVVEDLRNEIAELKRQLDEAKKHGGSSVGPTPAAATASPAGARQHPEGSPTPPPPTPAVDL